jgi:hypothetical protein
MTNEHCLKTPKSVKLILDLNETKNPDYESKIQQGFNPPTNR